MLTKIKEMSIQAQQALMVKFLEYDDSSQERQDLQVLLIAYRQLDALIMAAEIEHATAGLAILSRQLNRPSNELNAAVLLENFLKVLALPTKTTFSLKQEPYEMNALDTAKLLTILPLMFTVVMMAMMSPALLMSPMPWLYLAISALPLLITYALDNPFSMSRWYQEMAGIEKGLGYSILGFGIMGLLIGAGLPEITLLALGMMLISTLISGLSLLQHSKHLQHKHEVLSEANAVIKQNLPHGSIQSLQTFFKPDQSAAVREMVTALRAIH